LNIWYESRLVEEGIEDMQNLATADIVNLMLYTRVPVERLIDWIDQSHLYLRVKVCNRDECTHRLCTRRLRELGIRTATDLENTFGVSGIAYDERAADLAPEKLEAKTQFIKKLLPHDAEAIWAILRSLQDEDNMWHVRAWKDYPRRVLKSIESIDGRHHSRTKTLAPIISGADSEMAGSATSIGKPDTSGESRG
jgi:hypothetical protein